MSSVPREDDMLVIEQWAKAIYDLYILRIINGE